MYDTTHVEATRDRVSTSLGLLVEACCILASLRPHYKYDKLRIYKDYKYICSNGKIFNSTWENYSTFFTYMLYNKKMEPSHKIFLEEMFSSGDWICIRLSIIFKYYFQVPKWNLQKLYSHHKNNLEKITLDQTII